MPIPDSRGRKQGLPSHRVTRYTVGGSSEEFISLSSALARVQRLAGTNTITIARRIGFAMGLELASRHKTAGVIDSELTSIFRRLNLGKVVLREWGPVVFVTRTRTRSESLKAAFGEGIVEGLVHARMKERVFVRHSVQEDQTPSGAKRK